MVLVALGYILAGRWLQETADTGVCVYTTLRSFTKTPMPIGAADDSDLWLQTPASARYPGL